MANCRSAKKPRRDVQINTYFSEDEAYGDICIDCNGGGIPAESPALVAMCMPQSRGAMDDEFAVGGEGGGGVTAAHLPVNLLVIAVAEGVKLNLEAPTGVLKRLSRVLTKGAQLHVTRVQLPGEAPILLSLRLLAASSWDALAVLEYIQSFPNQRPAPLVVLARQLLLAVCYDPGTLDYMTVYRLQMRAKTQAINVLRDMIENPDAGITNAMLRGNYGATALWERLRPALAARMELMPAYGGSEDRIHILCDARKKRASTPPLQRKRAAPAIKHGGWWNPLPWNSSQEVVPPLPSPTAAVSAGIQSIDSAPQNGHEVEYGDRRKNVDVVDRVWQPTMFNYVMTCHDGNRRWFRCRLCEYVGVKMSNTIAHFDRIHVKYRRSIPRKQKYRNLSNVPITEVASDSQFSITPNDNKASFPGECTMLLSPLPRSSTTEGRAAKTNIAESALRISAEGRQSATDACMFTQGDSSFDGRNGKSLPPLFFTCLSPLLQIAASTPPLPLPTADIPPVRLCAPAGWGIE